MSRTVVRSSLFFCLLFLLGGSERAFAQYRFDHWTADNGLPQNGVYSITQTRDGYLWFTTLDGLVRFDGVRFTVFDKSNTPGLPTNRFLSLFADTDDTLWLGSEEVGLAHLANGQVQTFTTANGLPTNQINEITRDVDGTLLALTPSGTARLQDGHFQADLSKDDRRARVYMSPSNTRWEVDASGVHRFQAGRVTHYPIPFDPQRITLDPYVQLYFNVQLLEDRDGALWLAASGNLYRMKDGQVTTYTAKDGVPQSVVTCFLQDRQGQLWIGTRDQGVCRLSGNRFTCYNTTNGLSSNYIRAIFEDREGTIWVGTHERGINRLTRQVITPLSAAQGLSDKNVYPVLEDSKGNFWIGSLTTLSQYKDGQVKNFTEKGKVYIVQSLAEDRDGRLWVGGAGGVDYYADGKFTGFTEQLGFQPGEADFWVIHQDRQGTLWFGTRKGLAKFQDGKATRYTTKDGLPGDDVKVICETRDGRLWFGTYGGLALLERSPDVATEKITFTSFTEAQGLASNQVRSLYEDDQGTLWAGTYDGGLSRFRDGKFTTYRTANGLYSNGVFAILEDGRGNFWMSSNQGIYRVSRAELEDFAAGKLNHITSTFFGKSDGMLNAECNGGRQPAGLKTRDGKLWFPTQDGVAIIDPDAIPFNPQPPPVVIESATLSGQNVPLMGELKIEPGQGNLEIRYTGLSFIKPEQIRFRYRLEGLDTDWTEAGIRRSAYYPYLPPGDYTFKVVATNADGVWNLQGESLRITVVPPFYRTAWFIVLASLGVVGLGVLIFWYRVAQLHKEHATREAFSRQLLEAQESFSRRLIDSQEAERKRIAGELHDSLSQNLVIIKNRAMIGLKGRDDPEQAFEQIEEIAGAAGEALAEVREIAQNLRPFHIDRLGLTKAIEALVRKVNTGNLHCTAQVDKIDGLLTPDLEINLYRIIQESLNNIVKHAGATDARVMIERREQTIEINIRDNGKGFTPQAARPGESTNGSGMGLVGINERARILGCVPVIQSAPAEGTQICLSIKLSGKNKK
jgi:signal transduction histidine kinase/ligand-binding sensor domain-containing protein